MEAEDQEQSRGNDVQGDQIKMVEFTQVSPQPKAVSPWYHDALWMFIAWLLGVTVIGSIAGRGALNYHRLSRHGVAIEGLALGPKPHQLLSYSYEVNGKTYEGVGLPGKDDPPFYKIPSGAKVTVHYLPDAPEVSCLGDPEKRYSSEIIPVLAASFLFPTLIVIRLAFWVRKRRR